MYIIYNQKRKKENINHKPLLSEQETRTKSPNPAAENTRPSAEPSASNRPASSSAPPDTTAPPVSCSSSVAACGTKKCSSPSPPPWLQIETRRKMKLLQNCEDNYKIRDSV